MTSRIFIVGTDTGVGKTELACALLRAASHHGRRVVPFKPAQSGSELPSDIDRLLDAADLPRDEAHLACPFRYAPALAPGVVDSPEAFRRPGSSHAPPVNAALSHALTCLDDWIARHRPEFVLVEGAGGLHVPMPGGTWQTAWIEALADVVVVVGRAGLGTINHTLLTIDASRSLRLPLVGFFLNEVSATPDVSRADNATVIANARNLPHLGTLAHRDSDEAHRSDHLFERLLAALSQRDDCTRSAATDP